MEFQIDGPHAAHQADQLQAAIGSAVGSVPSEGEFHFILVSDPLDLGTAEPHAIGKRLFATTHREGEHIQGLLRNNVDAVQCEAPVFHVRYSGAQVDIEHPTVDGTLQHRTWCDTQLRSHQSQEGFRVPGHHRERELLFSVIEGHLVAKGRKNAVHRVGHEFRQFRWLKAPFYPC